MPGKFANNGAPVRPGVWPGWTNSFGQSDGIFVRFIYWHPFW
jgi:hypothetical protein